MSKGLTKFLFMSESCGEAEKLVQRGWYVSRVVMKKKTPKAQ